MNTDYLTPVDFSLSYLALGAKISLFGGFLLLGARALFHKAMSTTRSEIRIWATVYSLTSLISGLIIYFAGLFFPLWLDGTDGLIYLVMSIALFISIFNKGARQHFMLENKMVLLAVAFIQASNSFSVSTGTFAMFMDLTLLNFLVILVPFLMGFMCFSVAIAFLLGWTVQKWPATKTGLIILAALGCLAKGAWDTLFWLFGIC